MESLLRYGMCLLVLGEQGVEGGGDDGRYVQPDESEGEERFVDSADHDADIFVPVEVVAGVT